MKRQSMTFLVRVLTQQNIHLKKEEKLLVANFTAIEKIVVLVLDGPFILIHYFSLSKTKMKVKKRFILDCCVRFDCVREFPLSVIS